MPIMQPESAVGVGGLLSAFLKQLAGSPLAPDSVRRLDRLLRVSAISSFMEVPITDRSCCDDKSKPAHADQQGLVEDLPSESGSALAILAPISSAEAQRDYCFQYQATIVSLLGLTGADIDLGIQLSSGEVRVKITFSGSAALLTNASYERVISVARLCPWKCADDWVQGVVRLAIHLDIHTDAGTLARLQEAGLLARGATRIEWEDTAFTFRHSPGSATLVP